MLNKFLPLVLTATLGLLGVGASAQNTPADGRGRNWCASDAVQEGYYAEHPAAQAADKAIYKQIQARIALQRSTAAPDVTIPIVVHVIHAGGADNISDRQINSAIDQLNADYQKLNADTVDTAPLFRPIAASLGFQFRLAKKDPNGNCTNGITRHYEPTLVNDKLDGAVQAVSNWDQRRYLNIWVVSTIGTPVPGSGFTLGYSYRPTSQFNPRDGFVIRGDFFGNQGTSSPQRAENRVGTHEIGHYFGLNHPWGGGAVGVAGNCGDDQVADTPLTNGTFSCNLSYAPCTDASGQPIVANVQNFMDYAPCQTMFTLGQKQLMRGVLTNFRSNLTTPANLVSTGTNDGYVAQECAPIAAFAPAPGTSTNVCINSPVTLRDFSSNFSAAGGTLTYSWSFPGGNPATATGQTVTVSYPTAGFYSVTETVSNSIGSSVKTITNLIRVEGPTGGETAPFAQSFEDSNFPNLYTAPTLRNYELAGATSNGAASTAFRWTRQTAFPAADGSAYLVVNNRIYPAGAITTLITPNINLAGVPNPAVLSFSRAFAQRTASSNDELRISFSNDCGATWSSTTVLNAAALATTAPVDGYVPASSADWQNLTVAIPAQFQGSGLFKVRLQMVNGSAQGNNFYLDNLRVSGPLATKADALASRGISVYPNPLTNETAVHLTLATATEVQLSLTDVVGRNVLTLPAKTYGAGQQKLSLQTAGRVLRAGVYVVRISLNGETFTSKLSVE